MSNQVANPLDDSDEGTPRFENSPIEYSKVLEGVNQMMSVIYTFDEKQSSHLTNVMEITQGSQLKYDKLQLLQQTMHRIETNEILEYRQQLQNQMSFSVQSSNISQPVITSTFKLLIKQKQKQKAQTQLNSEIQAPLTQRNVTKIHDCSHEEIVQKPRIPERYKSIQSHYSPKRLELYLNKEHIDYSTNQKWLSYGNHKENKNKRAISNDVKLSHNEISAIEQLKKSLMIQNSRIKNNTNLSNFQNKSPIRNQQKSVTFNKPIQNQELEEIQQRVDRLSQRLLPKKF
ncbi:hypothetical protein pb186bvf_002541 [Paramecium bursaria]